MDTTTSLGDLCQCLVTLPVKKCFLMFTWKTLWFSLCPMPLVLSLGITEKSLALFSLHPPFRYLCAFVGSSLSLLQAEQSQLAQPFLYRRDAPVP